jgi:hypothetical protein
MNTNDFIAGVRARATPHKANAPFIVFKDQKAILAMLFASGYIQDYAGLTTYVHKNRVHWDIGNVERRMLDHVTFRLHPAQWGTQMLSYLYPSEMETRHIINTVKMIRDGRMKRESCSGIPTTAWVDIFINELVARAIAETTSVE